MTDYCSYHPQEQACGYCEDCARRYCRQCLGGTDSPRTRYCPRCRRPLTRQHPSLTDDDDLLAQTQPFFAWPFRVQPFLALMVCTLIALVLPQNLTGAIIAGILALALMAYGFAAIRSLQGGEEYPPAIARLWSDTEYDRVGLLLALVVLMGALTLGAHWLAGLWLSIPVGLLLAIVFPASVAVIAEDGGVTDALNPARLLTPMLELGWTYVVLSTHLVLMVFGVAVLVDFLLAYTPRLLGHPLSGFVASYLFLVFCAMLGQLLHQRRAERQSPTATPAAPARPLSPESTLSERRQQDTDILMALKDGRYDEAQTLLIQALKAQPGNDDYAARLFRLLDARADTAALAQQHERVFPWLVREQDGAALVRSLRRLYEWDPEFEIASPELTFQCAQVLFLNESYRSVYRLLRGFHRRFPDYSDTARVYLLLARTLANGLGEHHKARQLLEFVQSSYQEHPIQDLIPTYLERLDQGQPLEI